MSSEEPILKLVKPAAPSPAQRFRMNEIVWAHFKGYPKWPAKIIPTPDYLLSQSDRHTGEYVVVFYEASKKPGQVSWVKDTGIWKFQAELDSMKAEVALAQSMTSKNWGLKYPFSKYAGLKESITKAEMEFNQRKIVNPPTESERTHFAGQTFQKASPTPSHRTSVPHSVVPLKPPSGPPRLLKSYVHQPRLAQSSHTVLNDDVKSNQGHPWKLGQYFPDIPSPGITPLEMVPDCTSAAASTTVTVVEDQQSVNQGRLSVSQKHDIERGSSAESSSTGSVEINVVHHSARKVAMPRKYLPESEVIGDQKDMSCAESEEAEGASPSGSVATSLGSEKSSFSTASSPMSSRLPMSVLTGPKHRSQGLHRQSALLQGSALPERTEMAHHSASVSSADDGHGSSAGIVGKRPLVAVPDSSSVSQKRRLPRTEEDTAAEGLLLLSQLKGSDGEDKVARGLGQSWPQSPKKRRTISPVKEMAGGGHRRSDRASEEFFVRPMVSINLSTAASEIPPSSPIATAAASTSVAASADSSYVADPLLPLDVSSSDKSRTASPAKETENGDDTRAGPRGGEGKRRSYLPSPNMRCADSHGNVTSGEMNESAVAADEEEGDDVVRPVVAFNLSRTSEVQTPLPICTQNPAVVSVPVPIVAVSVPSEPPWPPLRLLDLLDQQVVPSPDTFNWRHPAEVKAFEPDMMGEKCRALRGDVEQWLAHAFVAARQPGGACLPITVKYGFAIIQTSENDAGQVMRVTGDGEVKSVMIGGCGAGRGDLGLRAVPPWLDLAVKLETVFHGPATPLPFSGHNRFLFEWRSILTATKTTSFEHQLIESGQVPTMTASNTKAEFSTIIAGECTVYPVFGLFATTDIPIGGATVVDSPIPQAVFDASHLTVTYQIPWASFIMLNLRTALPGGLFQNRIGKAVAAADRETVTSRMTNSSSTYTLFTQDGGKICVDKPFFMTFRPTEAERKSRHMELPFPAWLVDFYSVTFNDGKWVFISDHHRLLEILRFGQRYEVSDLVVLAEFLLLDQLINFVQPLPSEDVLEELVSCNSDLLRKALTVVFESNDKRAVASRKAWFNVVGRHREIVELQFSLWDLAARLMGEK
ncbi:hypothetical protein BV898_07629 [Hypsibius exemplaris]|uniref:PWWP domain-containing protein n=1 Tax=Hypsibius exemplaris TaxID=2072580 RepID=A0A1W0WSV4_HYPEX|nr:hypothetical protein BV898_07629 [Hypsibius exemplaris]